MKSIICTVATNSLIYFGMSGGTILVHELGHALVGRLLGADIVEVSVSPLFQKGNCKLYWENKPPAFKKLLVDVTGPICGMIATGFILYPLRTRPYATFLSVFLCIKEVLNLLPYEGSTDGIRLWKYLNYFFGSGGWERIMWNPRSYKTMLFSSLLGLGLGTVLCSKITI
jgi:hypothetical protein